MNSSLVLLLDRGYFTKCKVITAAINLSYRRRLCAWTDYKYSSTQEGIWESTFCFLPHLGLGCDSSPLPAVARWIVCVLLVPGSLCFPPILLLRLLPYLHF